MTIQLVERFLFWCMVINLGLMCVTFVLITVFRPMAAGIHAKLFGVSEAFFNQAAYAFLGIYKLLTFFFAVIPWIVLAFLV